MSIVGEAALTALCDQLFYMLASSDAFKFDFIDFGFHVHEQLKEWRKILPTIQAVLNDAEEKQTKDESVKIWLADLQDLAYDADDILDEYSIKALRWKLKQRDDKASSSKVRKVIPASSSNITLAALKNKSRMISKIKEITARLDSLNSRRSQLLLREISGGRVWPKDMKPRLQPSSLVNKDHVYGRETEKSRMLDLLRRSDGGDGVDVIPIFGMGGIGKTTLAQLVYNDTSIKNLFDHKAWVCVSDDFDAIRITKTILQSISSEPFDQNDLNLLQVKLKEMLSGKKLLLVLDDIWNDNYNDWTILCSPFGVGTKIIVTTRSEKISSIVFTVDQPFPLHQLSYDHCLHILTQHALGESDFQKHPELKEAGENIVRKCNGLPLAAKAIAGLLRTTMDQDAWENISRSEIWDLPHEQCNIIPALQLSYYHLPSHLKRCFAFCSLLPKDYEFEEEEIILLWRAEGFLQQTKATCQSIEDLGHQYFRDLLSRSFFQISSNNKSRFVMHDLINDLAQSVAGDICSNLESDKGPTFSKRTRHYSYFIEEYDGVKRFQEFDKMRQLRTFLPFKQSNQGFKFHYLTNTFLVDVLPKLKRLRVLSLRSYCITELPDGFKNLKHLRYLDFSYTQIKRLPDSICNLCNLEILVLKGCSKLEMLPSKIEFLIDLKFLDLRGANSLKEMPLGIGQLTNLQKLSNFNLSNGNGQKIKELKSLLNLKGELCLSRLENIVVANDALEANLINKSGLRRLNLHWSAYAGNTRRNNAVEEVLKFLCPHAKLKDLTIENYSGSIFPNWVADPSFENLLSFTLKNCKNCKSLPSSIGKLPLLKHLSIGGMDEIYMLGLDFTGENEAGATFMALETLSFQDMANWKEWQAVNFPSLNQLLIKNCPKLVVLLSNTPGLHDLKINGCSELVIGDDADFPSLRTVSLSNILKLCTPTELLLSKLTKVEELKIDDFDQIALISLQELGLLRLLTSLRSLEIYKCPQLVLLEPEEVQEQQWLQLGDFRKLEFLKIEACERLERLPNVLHFLHEIEINVCPSIVSISKNNFPPALKKLKIYDCDKLQQCLMDEEENTSLLELLEIRSAPSLKSLSFPSKLQYLQVRNCPELVFLSSSRMLPVELKQLHIENCPQLESIAEAIQENACLEDIYIRRCEDIKSLPQGLDKIKHLKKIDISSYRNLVPFALSDPPTSLRDLSISGCEKLEALPKCMHNLNFLQRLLLLKCSAEMPEGGFPTNLKSLIISLSPKIVNSLLLEWGLHRLTSLQEAYIDGEGCLDLVSFPQEIQELGMMLPPSLSIIRISNFNNIKSLSSKAFQHLTCLQQLSLRNCPKLASLPRKNRLLSLLQLHIINCPLLRERCNRDKGQDWSKIAHIPYVTIDGKNIIPKQLN